MSGTRKPRWLPATTLGVLSLAACATLITPAGSAKPPEKGKCTDTPVTWTILATSQSAILPDAGGAYPAVIQVCNGTGDGVLSVVPPRQITLDFVGRRLGGPESPSWAFSPVTGTGVFLNVRRLLYSYRSDADYRFTTRFGSDVPGYPYNIRMWNPDTAAISSDLATSPFVAAANTPYLDSLVNVQHCQAGSPTCGGLTNEAWLVWSDDQPAHWADNPTGETASPAVTHVLGLVTTGKKNTPVAAGQFSMPFAFRIEMQ